MDIVGILEEVANQEAKYRATSTGINTTFEGLPQ